MSGLSRINAKRCRALLLAVVLVLVQAGSLIHAAEHTLGFAPDTNVCLLCYAANHFGKAPVTHAFVIAAVAATGSAPPAEVPRPIIRFSSTNSARAPPFTPSV